MIFQNHLSHIPWLWSRMEKMGVDRINDLLNDLSKPFVPYSIILESPPNFASDINPINASYALI